MEWCDQICVLGRLVWFQWVISEGWENQEQERPRWKLWQQLGGQWMLPEQGTAGGLQRRLRLSSAYGQTRRHWRVAVPRGWRKRRKILLSGEHYASGGCWGKPPGCGVYLWVRRPFVKLKGLFSPPLTKFPFHWSSCVLLLRTRDHASQRKPCMPYRQRGPCRPDGGALFQGLGWFCTSNRLEGTNSQKSLSVSFPVWTQILLDPCLGIFSLVLPCCGFKIFYLFIFFLAAQKCIAAVFTVGLLASNSFQIQIFLVISSLNADVCALVYTIHRLRVVQFLADLFDNLKFLMSGAFILLFASGNHS